MTGESPSFGYFPRIDTMNISNQTTQKYGNGFLRAALCAAALGGAALHAADWPHWRGPDRTGISKESNWLSEWPSQGPKIAWKAKVGLGYSSVVVADGKAFTVGFDGGKDTVYCFDAVNGKEVWKHSYPSQLGDKYFQGGTTGTPTFHDGRLYWLSRWGDLIAFEAGTGKIVWSKNIQKETQAPIPTWGFSGAPLVHEHLLILNVGEAGTAVEKDTGKLVWASAKKESGYSSPLPFKDEDGTFVALGTASAYVAIDPLTGEEAARVPWKTEYGVNAPDPVFTERHFMLSTGYGTGAAMFERGNPETPVWKNKTLRTQMNAGVLYNGHVYGVDGDTTEKAKLKCIDFMTGQEKWAESNFGSGGLTIADGKIIALSAAGELMVAPATPDGFKPTARAQIFGGTTWTAPVLANGMVYCRNSRGDLACVDLRK